MRFASEESTFSAVPKDLTTETAGRKGRMGTREIPMHPKAVYIYTHRQNIHTHKKIHLLKKELRWSGLCFAFFEIGSHYTALAGLKSRDSLDISLLQHEM